MPRLIIASQSTAFRAGIHAILSGDPEFHFWLEVKGPSDLVAGNCDDCIWIFSADDLKWLLKLGHDQLVEARGFLVIGEEDVISEILTLSGNGLHGWGILPMQASNEALHYAIHAIDQGLTVISPGMVGREMMARSVLDQKSEKLLEPYEALTERELDVLSLLGQGLANKQIALRLQLSENTVKFHISSIYSKLGVNNRTEALRKGAGLGLVAL
jgi:DNA-binding NarL/FixJ family response regulator